MRALILLVIFAVSAKSALSATISSDKVYRFDKINQGLISRIFETELNETLECLRYTLETGLPEIEIPSLASIDIPDINLDLAILGLETTSGYFHVTGGVFRGLTSFHATDLTTLIFITPEPGFSVDITLVLSEFYLELDYDMDMIAEGIPVYGNGKVIIDWKDVELGIQFFLGFGDALELSGVNIFITIGDSEVTITGWFNDEEHSQVVTDLVNDYLIPHWINGQTEEINEVLGPLVELIVNLLFAIVEIAGSEEELNAILEAIINHCAARPDAVQLFLK